MGLLLATLASAWPLWVEHEPQRFDEENTKMNEIDKMKAMFADGSGFGDPDARRDAEIKLQTLLAERQDRTARQMNILTMILVIVASLEIGLHAYEIWENESVEQAGPAYVAQGAPSADP